VVRRPVIVAPPPAVVDEYPVYAAPRVYAAPPVYAYAGPGWRGGWGLSTSLPRRLVKSRICRGVGVQRFGCSGERLRPQLAANAVFVHGLALRLSHVFTQPGSKLRNPGVPPAGRLYPQLRTGLAPRKLTLGARTGPTRRLSKCEGKRSVFRTRQTGSLDNLIRPFEQLWRNRHTNCPSRLEIEYQYMLLQDLDRQVARFGAP
jgi:hypothetical protein